MTLFDQAMPPPVDLHCHLSAAGGYGACKPGALMLSVTNDPASWEAMHRRSPSGVAWAAGLHPCELIRDDPRVGDLLRVIGRASAIGEVGLDYSRRSAASPASQRAALSRILNAQESTDRVVTLHSVGATGDILAAIASNNVRGAVLHWFLGNTAEMSRALDLDVFFSVNVAMLRSKRGRIALGEMPPNRVLTETDAPFTNQGRSPTRPGGVDSMERALAQLWRTDEGDVRNRLWSNLRALQGRVAVQTFTEVPMT